MGWGRTGQGPRGTSFEEHVSVVIHELGQNGGDLMRSRCRGSGLHESSPVPAKQNMRFLGLGR